ncbi:MAG: S8 family serine peptidase [Bacteroidales bacterium]|nr:S8 family serine peptidase [Bacteroidales bacterium]
MVNRHGWLLSVFFVFITFNGFSQQNFKPDRYFVEFQNKDFSGYDLSSPEDFLSPRAIERRNKMDISYDQKDLPVNQVYLDSIRNLGAKIHTVTKWLNGAVISVDTLPQLQLISAQPFVKNVDTVRYQSDVAFNKDVNGTEEIRSGMEILTGYLESSIGFDYGYGENQIKMMNLHHLHTERYNGKGKLIAVLDAGFANADQMVSLNHIFDSHRVVAVRDFVDNDNDVFHSSSHGQIVLSIMASKQEGIFVGAAPGASYALLRSEDVGSEYPVEEIYWAAASEYADSLGADIINSSLGYSQYEYPDLSYNRKDLDGNTTYSTKAADIAASRGMLVVNSAGNEGNSSWYYVTAPADGDSVLTVGAVDQNRYYASFSSKGPAYDGDIKPNVVSVGEGTVFLNYNDQIAAGNGTSFSSPLIAGSAACLWQAFPNAGNIEIKNAIEHSGSQFLNPDSLVGYGLPDFQLAGILMDTHNKTPDDFIKVVPNPFQDKLYLISETKTGNNTVFELFDLTGRLIKSWEPIPSLNQNFYTLSNLNSLKQGTYILRVSNSAFTQSIKVLKAK